MLESGSKMSAGTAYRMRDIPYHASHRAPRWSAWVTWDAWNTIDKGSHKGSETPRRSWLLPTNSQATRADPDGVQCR